MSPTTVPSREQILAEIAAHLAPTPEVGEPLDLVERYYRHVATEELADRPVEMLSSAVAHHLSLALHREPGTANVSIFTPTVSNEVWSNPRTLVQVVTDDMPFLVDSVTSEPSVRASTSTSSSIPSSSSVVTSSARSRECSRSTRRTPRARPVRSASSASRG